MNKDEAREIEEKYVSKCCGAKIEVMESGMPNSGFGMEQYWGYRCEKCSESCEIEEKDECQHQETVAINEEGHAGVYCVGCGEQIEREC